VFQRLFFWPVFALVMGFVLGGTVVWSFQSGKSAFNQHNTANEHDAAQHEPKSKKEETDEALAHYTLWLMVFTGVLAVATIGLGVATAGLYLTGEKQIKVAESAAKAADAGARFTRNANRPFFTVFDITMINWDIAVKRDDWSPVMQITFDVENVGNGIGLFESYRIGKYIGATAADAPIEFEERNLTGRIPVRVDAKFRAGAAYLVFQIEDDDRRAMIRYRKTLYIYGYLTYSDLFKVRRNTGFMFEFIPNKVFPEQGAFVMTPHPIWDDGEISEHHKI
jgi:hypothetical protein